MSMSMSEEKKWPDDPMIIPVKNGTYNIGTREFSPHADEKENLRIPVDYKPDEQCPEWQKFLDDILPDKEVQKVVQKLFGYCLVRDTRYQRVFFLYGPGACGKSTLLHVLKSMVGLDNTSYLYPTDLTRNFRVQFLWNKLVNIPPVPLNTRSTKTMAYFKAAVSGCPMIAYRKHRDPFQFHPFAKWIFHINTPLVIPDNNEGIVRRCLVIYFNQHPPIRRFFQIHQMVNTELSGIFNWAIDGLQRLLIEEEGF